MRSLYLPRNSKREVLSFQFNRWGDWGLERTNKRTSLPQTLENLWARNAELKRPRLAHHGAGGSLCAGRHAHWPASPGVLLGPNVPARQIQLAGEHGMNYHYYAGRGTSCKFHLLVIHNMNENSCNWNVKTWGVTKKASNIIIKT